MFSAASNAPSNMRTDSSAARWQKGNSKLVLSMGNTLYETTLTPLKICVISLLLAVMTLSFILGGGYLFLKDDFVSATLSRQARMQHAYEDRITALRAQVDLVTSRQLLDQQAVENRVSELMRRQNELKSFQDQLRTVSKRAGVVEPVTPTQKPAISTQPNSGTGLRLGSLVGSNSPFVATAPIAPRFEIAEAAPQVLNSMEDSLNETEKMQLAKVRDLKKTTEIKTRKLASILSKEGIRVPSENALGGPLIELKSGNRFLSTVQALDNSLNMLEKVRIAAKSLPHGSPTPGQKISSRFGTRKDPFTGRRAVHGGLDFRAKRGVPVLATASGKVTKAGRMGGYGKLVEIDHGGGITTRYAHLSKIRVRVGQKITRGKRIGNVGSTGRSTGPHLHYEVRRRGRVLNPIHYVRLAKHLKPYL